MSYIQNKTRVFKDAGDVEFLRKRSEGRMKTFPSATDARAWCDITEDRRQYILKLILKGGGKCEGSGKYIPIDIIIDILLASKNAEIEKLLKEIEELKKLIDQNSSIEDLKPKMIDSDFQTGDPDGDARRKAEAEAEAWRKKYEEEKRKRIEAEEAAENEAKCECPVVDMLVLERDRLQMRVNELGNMEEECNILMCKLRCMENVKNERDMYKAKYEELVGLECECNMLRAQLDRATCLENERDALQRQVCELQCCISDQEDEIKKLSSHIDSLSQGKDEQEEKIQDALACMRCEIEMKDQRIASSEQKLASVQERLRNSLHTVSCEAACLRARIDELERELGNSNALLMEKQNQVNYLYNQIRERGSCMCNSDTDKCSKRPSINEADAICQMKKKLEAAKMENEKIQMIAGKMSNMMGYEQVEDILKQSRRAVLRVTEELGKSFSGEMANM